VLLGHFYPRKRLGPLESLFDNKAAMVFIAEQLNERLAKGLVIGYNAVLVIVQNVLCPIIRTT
jgi:hypothetical protein